jgi:hypothetical protein
MVLKLGQFGKEVRNTGEVLKCVLEKDGEDQLDGSCEICGITAQSQGG